MIYISVVNCQLCGKEIGPFRLLRDTEFCSSVHRKRYGQRLGKALHQLVTPDLVSKKSAGFQTSLPFHEIVHRSSNCWTLFECGEHPILVRRTWDLPLPQRLGTYFLKTSAPSLILPPPVLSCRLTEPSLLPSAEIKTGTWIPSRAAAGSLLLLSGQAMRSAWPAATARPAEACARLKMAWFHASTRMNLPVVLPAHVEGMPAREISEESPTVAGLATWQPRPASRAAYPSIAALLGARLSSSMSVRLAGEIANPNSLLPISALPAGEPLTAAPAAQDRAARTIAPDEPTVVPSREITTPVLPAISGGSSLRVAAPVADTIAGVPGENAPVLSPAVSSLRLRSLDLELAAERPVAELPQNFEPIASICWMQVPTAQAVERMVHARVNVAWAEGIGIAAPAVDGLAIAPPQEPEASTCWMRVPPAEAAERIVQPVTTGEMCLSLGLTVLKADALAIAPPQQPEAETSWMAAPGAEAVERFVAPLMSSTLATVPESIAPSMAALGISSTYLPISTNLFLPPAAEPVASEVIWRNAAAFARFPKREMMLPAGLPVLNDFGKADSGQPAAAAQAPAADPVESMPAIPEFLAAPISIAPPVAAPQVAQFPISAAVCEAAFELITPAGAAPEEQLPSSRPASLVAIRTINVKAPLFRPVKARAVIPKPDLTPMEYYCHRISSTPCSRPDWITRCIEPALAPFAMQAVLERLDDLLKKPARKVSQEAKVVALPDSKLRPRNVALDRMAKIAAGVLMAAFLYYGARNFNLQNGSSSSSFGSASDVSSTTASARAPQQAEDTPKGPIARLQRVIANRAAVETTDSFRNGMANWGTVSKAWAPGWSRHPDGYVRPGELALFQPSIKYQDYRLEFYGQIESKSVGWVVRAKDKENYQAMKFTIIEPGLRPMIALVHYTVVGGKRGPKMQTPLNVMVHNNRPYHVAVDVRGSRFTTSIEGEQISTWNDNTLTAGGIGFFSEAGERARLYWMKVSKNQDWVGRICSYISGSNSSTQTADLFRPAIP